MLFLFEEIRLNQPLFFYRSAKSALAVFLYSRRYRSLYGTRLIITVLLLALVSCDSAVLEDQGFLATPGEILFISDESGTLQLYSMNAAGGDVRQLTDDPSFPILDADWSPDGTQIVLTSSKGGHPLYGPTLYIVNADGTGRYNVFHTEGVVPNDRTGKHPVWSPDGEKIAFKRLLVPEANGIYSIFVVDLKSQQVENLISPVGGSRTPTDWSKNDQVLLGYTTDYSAKDSLGRAIIYNYITQWDQQGVMVERLGQPGSGYTWPLWFSGEQHIAFSLVEAETQKLYTANSDGSDRRQMESGDFRFIIPIDLGPGDRHILAKGTSNSSAGWRDHIVLVHADGSGYVERSPFPNATNIPTSWLVSE